MESTLANRTDPPALVDEFGPVSRVLGARYFDGVRFPPEAEAELRRAARAGLRGARHAHHRLGQLPLPDVGPGEPRPAAGARGREPAPLVHPPVAQDGSSAATSTCASPTPGASTARGSSSSSRAPLGRAGRDATTRRIPSPRWWRWRARATGRCTWCRSCSSGRSAPPSSMPSLLDRVFGSPEAPGFVHSLVAFWRNHHRAQFRVGEPIDLGRFIRGEPAGPGRRASRARCAASLHHHLARETRAVFGPPLKSAERLLTRRCATASLRKTLDEHAAATKRKPESVQREATRNLKAIAAQAFSPRCWRSASPMLTGCSTASTTASRWTRRAWSGRSRRRAARRSSYAPATRATWTTW